MPPRRRMHDVAQDDIAQQEEIRQLRQHVDDLVQQFAALNHRPPSDSDTDETHDDNPFAIPHHRQDHHQDNRSWEASFKVDIPEFNGRLQADDFLDWLHTVDEILDFKQVPDHRRIPLVTMRLRGRAQAWWQQSKKGRQRAGKKKIPSWEKFKKHMRAAFLPYNFERELYQRFQLLRQGTRTVDDYTAEFYELLSRIDLGDSPFQLVSRYIGDLRLPL